MVPGTRERATQTLYRALRKNIFPNPVNNQNFPLQRPLSLSPPPRISHTDNDDADGSSNERVGTSVRRAHFLLDGVENQIGRVLLFHGHTTRAMGRGEGFSEDGVRRRRNTRPNFSALLRDRAGNGGSCGRGIVHVHRQTERTFRRTCICESARCSSL